MGFWVLGFYGCRGFRCMGDRGVGLQALVQWVLGFGVCCGRLEGGWGRGLHKNPWPQGVASRKSFKTEGSRTVQGSRLGS